MDGDYLASSRRIRRKRFFLKAGLGLAAILLVSLGVVGFFYIPKFKIKEISIEGADVLDKKEFSAEINDFLTRKLWKILPYDNIFIFPDGQTADEIMPKFPIIKSAVFRRDFPQKLSVFIEERKPAALLCRESEIQKLECAFADEAGFVFQLAPNFSGGIFLKFFDNRRQSTLAGAAIPADIGKNIIDAGEFRKLNYFVKLLSKENLAAGKIVIKDEGAYEIHLREKWQILLNDKNEPEQSFANLKLVLSQIIKEKTPQLEYIDLRLGNKVFYKLR